MLPLKLYKVGEVMEYSGLSRQMVHYYTQLELIKSVKRTPAGHRLYDESVFKRIQEIKRMQKQNKTLLEIKDILNGRNR